MRKKKARAVWKKARTDRNKSSVVTLASKRRKQRAASLSGGEPTG